MCWLKEDRYDMISTSLLWEQFNALLPIMNKDFKVAKQYFISFLDTLESKGLFNDYKVDNGIECPVCKVKHDIYMKDESRCMLCRSKNAEVGGCPKCGSLNIMPTVYGRTDGVSVENYKKFQCLNCAHTFVR